MDDRAATLKHLAKYSTNNHGIEGWIASTVNVDVLSKKGTYPITHAILNQWLIKNGLRGMTRGFFDYYWCHLPDTHPYDLKTLDGYDARYNGTENIETFDQFRWGMERFYIDSLLHYGNIRESYRQLSRLTMQQIYQVYSKYIFDTDHLIERGKYIPLHPINPDKRHFISEIACKTLGEADIENTDVGKDIIAAFKRLKSKKIKPTIKRIYHEISSIETEKEKKNKKDDQMSLFVLDEIMNKVIEDESDLKEFWLELQKELSLNRNQAIENTRNYLSMINEMDVYVATSMRRRDDFRNMAKFCRIVFNHPDLKKFHLRYFDPTLSAADGHEDKGLIECLMVRCAKLLVYTAGEKESYGKDAEAAMALSLGKPVIFFCNQETQQKFYREVHPLSRLIHIDTGVAVGAIVTTKEELVVELIKRIVTNTMQYSLVQHPDRKGYLRLIEKLTGSVVRIQTNDEILSQAFWNYYHGVA